MSFIYPLGLLGLIGIPILIIVYIIKNKHTEQIVSSTYLWTLSEKFLNKKKQIRLLSGIISLILQITAVIVISLLVAHPIIHIPNAAKEYCFILDASGSMNMQINGKTKMEIGKEKVEEIILSSSDGSKYTLVYVGDSTRVVYEKLGNKEKACELLIDLKPSGVTVSYENTLKYVQEYFNINNSLVTYLVTDRDYESKNINIINVSSDVQNYAILNTNYEINEGILTITGNIISYNSDANIELEIYIDDQKECADEVEVKKLEEKEFSYSINKTDFINIKTVIKNTDGLLEDNTNIIYNLEKEHAYTTLIISDNPFYLYSAISAYGNTTVEFLTTENYTSDVSGYDLYIFDAYTPEILPDDGTVWLFAPSVSIENSGFSVQDEIVNDKGINLSYAKNSSSAFKDITKGLLKEQIVVSKYYKYGLYRNFTTILTHNGNPIVFTGTTEKGNREVVFGFDLHDSNLPLLIDYLTFTNNLLGYSFPVILTDSIYTSGETALINILPSFDSIKVELPSGKTTYLDVNKEIAELKLTEVGTYKLIVMIDDEEKVFSIFVNLPEEESNLSFEMSELSLQGELGNNYSDGLYDKLVILFIILAVIFMADWVVYCYEQYQLR